MLKPQPVQNAVGWPFLIPFPPICVLILNPRRYEDTQENLGLQENVFFLFFQKAHSFSLGSWQSQLHPSVKVQYISVIKTF